MVSQEAEQTTDQAITELNRKLTYINENIAQLRRKINEIVSIDFRQSYFISFSIKIMN